MCKHVFISNLVNALLIQKLGLLSFLRMELEKTGLNPKWLHYAKLNDTLCDSNVLTVFTIYSTISSFTSARVGGTIQTCAVIMTWITSTCVDN